MKFKKKVYNFKIKMMVAFYFQKFIRNCAEIKYNNKKNMKFHTNKEKTINHYFCKI